MDSKRIFHTNLFSFDSFHRKEPCQSKTKGEYNNSYKLEVTISKKVLQPGLTANSDSLKDVVEKNIIKKINNQCLDNIIPNEINNQNLVTWIWNELQPYIELLNCELEKVALWDTPTSKTEMVREKN